MADIADAFEFIVRILGILLCAVAIVSAIAFVVRCIVVDRANANAEQRAERKLAERCTALVEQEHALTRRKGETEREIQAAVSVAVETAKSDAVRSLADLARLPGEARVVHCLRGTLLTVRFSLTRSDDGVAWVGVAWSVFPKPPHEFFVYVRRDENELHRDSSAENIYAEPLKPGRHRYVISLREHRREWLTDQLKYTLPVVSNEKIPAPPKLPVEVPAPAAPTIIDPQAERDRRLREMFREVVSRFMTVTDVKQECCKEIKARGYPSDDEEWMLNQLDALAQTMIGERQAET